MAYTITQADINAITRLDYAFGTTKHLPAWEDIPEEFKRFGGNVYVDTVNALFVGDEPPSGDVTFHEGFDDSEAGMKQFFLFVAAHLRSFEPKHEHKIAGLAYAISRVITIKTD